MHELQLPQQLLLHTGDRHALDLDYKHVNNHFHMHLQVSNGLTFGCNHKDCLLPAQLWFLVAVYNYYHIIWYLSASSAAQLIHRLLYYWVLLFMCLAKV